MEFYRNQKLLMNKASKIALKPGSVVKGEYQQKKTVDELDCVEEEKSLIMSWSEREHLVR